MTSTSSNHTYIDMMEEMGFPREAARQALIATKFKNIDAAIEHILINKLTASTSTSSNKSQAQQHRKKKRQQRGDASEVKEVDLGQVKYSQSVALVIGVEDYRLMKPLSGATNAAKNLCKVLETSLGFEVRKLLNQDVTNSSIMELVCSLKDLDENSRVIIAFVGHAKSEKTRKSLQEYFCCYDYDPSDESPLNKLKNAYYYRELYRTIEEYCYSKHIVLLLDCLFAEQLTTRGKKMSLAKAVQEDCFYAIASTVDEEVEREKVGPMFDDLSTLLLQQCDIGENKGYRGISDIAKALSKASSIKYGHLLETRGQVLFKLQTFVPSADKNSKQILHKISDGSSWQEIHEYWPDGIYLCVWDTNVSAQDSVNLGWFSVEKDVALNVHTCVAHKSGDKLIIYEFGLLDLQTMSPDIGLSKLERLALGGTGCVLATEWSLFGKLFATPFNLFTVPSVTRGYITDLHNKEKNRKWIRYCELTQGVDIVLARVKQFIESGEEDQHGWKGPEIYTLKDNNSHMFTHSLLRHLLNKDVDWVLDHVNSN